MIDGKDVTDIGPAQRSLAMIFQSYVLYPHMNVRKNIAFPLKMAKQPPDVIEAKVTKDAQTLRLADYLDRRPGQLSGDQRQRVAKHRFSNPKMGDTIPRLAFDGSNRQPKFILPPVRDRLKAQSRANGLALVSAMWCRYAFGETESGKSISANDPIWDRIQAAAKSARHDPRKFLEMRDIFGALAEHPIYVDAFACALQQVWSRGVRSTLVEYLEDRL